MKLLLLLLFTGFSICANAQDYIYSFEGNTDAQLIEEFESSLNAIKGVKECKVKMKEDTGKGEIFIYLNKDISPTDNELQFTPIDVKKLILEYKLTPIQFIESK